MPDTSGSVDLGSLTAEQQEQLNALAAEHPPTGPDHVHTAFTVIMTRDGQTYVTAYDGDQVIPEVEPSADLIIAALSVVKKDIETQQTAGITLQMQMQQARAMQEQIQASEVARNLGNLRG